MSKILELRTKRNTLWEQTKDFLEKNRGENGLVKAEAVEQYNKMAQVNAKASFKKGEAIVKLGADIPEDELREAVEKLGYKVTSIEMM